MASQALVTELPSGSVQPVPSKNVDEKEIAVLAYQFWHERGCPIGSDQADWFRAERELAGANRTDEEEVGNSISTERSIAHAEEPDSTVPRFPARSELTEASKRTALLKRA